VSPPEVAELSKLLENIFRSVNIALVNELAMLCDRMDIDVWEVVEAAATKPYGFMSFKPGPGMGGHCLPVDPFYLAWRAREFDMQTEFIELAGEVNQRMPYFCVERVARALNDQSKSVRGSRVGIFGVSYKPGVGDLRESPSLRDELAARDQQWDAKLTDIVSHLASDHYADIGQATLEKEKARAETRAMSKKLGALQQRLEHDHQAFRAARDKWIAMQKEREARLQQAIADLTRQLAEVRAAAATEIAALRGVPRRRVLIVHRDAALRDLSRRTLEPLGYEVLTAADGLEGLRVATAQKPDAVIAETLMPKMDGRAMMAFLQSRADTAGIRVALMAESTPDAVALQSTVASVLGG